MTTTSNSGLRAIHYSLFALAAGTLMGCSGGGGDTTTDVVAAPPPGPAPTPAATYTVGGTVNGLDGSIKLRINGTEDKTVTSPATTGRFDFATPLPVGANYSVAIASLPTKQNCVLTNATGTVTTANVVSIGVTCTTRAWTAGQQLDGDDVPVATFDAGMDKEGRVTAIFVKGVAPSGKIYAARGTPGASGQAVVWTAPVRLDLDAIPFQHASSFLTNNLGLAVAPNGNAHAVWVNKAPCGAGYTAASAGTCSYIYSSVFSAATETWAAPVLVSDASFGNFTNGSISFKPKPLINDLGDVAVHFGWYNQVSPPKTNAFSDFRGAIAWRAAGQTTFTKRAFADVYTGSQVLNSLAVLDSAGSMVVAGQRVQTSSANKDVFSYAGNVATGFAATDGTVIDTLGNDATLRDLSVGSSGDILLTWDQNDGAGLKIFASSATSATSAWSAPVAIATRTAEGVGLVSDAGDALFYASCTAYVRPKATGIWAAKAPAIPSGCGFSETAAAWTGDGSFLTYSVFGGQWNTYYQTNNSMAREASATLAGPDYLLGFNKGWGSSSKLVHTKKTDGNFIGAVLIVDNYDTLPTPSAASGDGRAGINNLWGFYLK